MFNVLAFFERIAYGFWDFIRRVVGLFMPFLSRAGDYQGYSRTLLRFLHVILVVGVLVGLYFIHQWLDLRKALMTSSWVLQKFWLPILFLLVYVLAWLGWWLWKLLGPEEDSTDFPDIAQAWDEAVAALNQAGIGLAEAPLFLVVGRPLGGEEAIFDAAALNLTVKNVPRRADAPLHVFANRDGIFVTCAGASLLGRQTALLAGEEEGYTPPAGGLLVGGSDSPADDPYKSMTLANAGPQARGIQNILQRAREQGRGPSQLTTDEKEQINVLVARGEAEATKKERKARAPLLKNTQEVERLTARFKYLCRLIVRDRRPYCPLNGMMMLVPVAASDTDDDANQTAAICQQEVALARATLLTNCPMFAMVCDLETLEGFPEFIERFPKEQRQRRVGQRFPLVPDLEAEAIPKMVDAGVAWVCNALFPNWVYKLFRLESAEEEIPEIVRGNIQLFYLMGQMRERQKRLSRIFTKGLATESNRPMLLGGCYVSATGNNPHREQAFIAGVFRRLIESQNFVSWTAKAIEEEANFKRWTQYGYIGVGIGSVVLSAVIYWLWPRG